MARRSRAREVVLQLLYLNDQNPPVTPERAAEFLHRRLRDEEIEHFAAELFQGTLAHAAQIDPRLGELAENWSVERMAAVDRNVLRLGSYELLFQPETPVRVVIDEAVELAKRYGAAESPAFVNGILDRLAATREVKPTEPPTGN